MAVGALRAEVAIVNVVGCMTSTASRWNVVCPAAGVTMTIRARQFGVTAIERKFRVYVMVERCVGPTACRMTVTTFVA